MNSNIPVILLIVSLTSCISAFSCSGVMIGLYREIKSLFRQGRGREAREGEERKGEKKEGDSLVTYLTILLLSLHLAHALVSVAQWSHRLWYARVTFF